MSRGQQTLEWKTQALLAINSFEVLTETLLLIISYKPQFKIDHPSCLHFVQVTTAATQ